MSPEAKKRMKSICDQHVESKECTCDEDDYSCAYRDSYHDFSRGYEAGMQDPDAGKTSQRQTWNEYHGCFTGDCPHDNVNDCIQTLREAAKESDFKPGANKELLEECEKVIDGILSNFALDWYCSVMSKDERPTSVSSGLPAKVYNQEMIARLDMYLKKATDLRNKLKAARG